ncbi:MAG TPA: SIS domain-containing protein [Steroidobacteraceae bacterium]|jgi:glucosamine--fructose-6-phosphate aminotransferase (isomerizing)
MYREAAESAAAVRRQLHANAEPMRQLGAVLRRVAPRAVVTIARGSSDHAATYARYLLETRCGVLTASAAPSVSSVYAAQPDLRGALCLAISQSGRSPDLLAAADAARSAGGLVIALVNAEDAPLAARADHVVWLRAGVETSVAATKSHVASLAAILHLVAEWSTDASLSEALAALPDGLDAAWQLDWSAAIERLKDSRNLFVLGRGLGLGVAQEAALKLKETSGLHAEGISAAELQHGPMALVQRGFPVFLFAQEDETSASNAALAAQLVGRGAALIVAGIPVPGALELPTVGAHPATQTTLMIQAFYRLAEALARARGLDPDRPPHLEKVTETM